MQYVVGDRPLLKVTFKEDGSPIDLSPSTDDDYKVYIRASLNGETAVETLMTESDPNNGVATHRFPASGSGAIDEQGVLEYEFYLLDATVSGNAYYTSQKFRRKVRAKVG